MIFILFAAIFIACIAAFGILLIGKLGIRDDIVAKAPELVSRLFDCDFCLSFWVSFNIALIFSILFSDIRIMLTPFIATPIIRILI